MVIIAFSEKTSKIFPRIVCRRFRHCAPIIPTGRHMIMYQFTTPGRIAKIKIDMSGLRRLRAAGWRFVYVPGAAAPDFDGRRAPTCVALSKRALSLHAPQIQTPDALYNYLRK